MMLFRVLAAALVCSAPIAVSAAGLPRVGLAPELDTVVPAGLAAELRARRLGGSAAPHPLDAEGEHAMWDPLGDGCIDAADPAGWLPEGRRDPDAGVLCLPQPCARLLSEEEMKRDVLGRPLADGEWDTYARRFSDTCVAEVAWDGEGDSALDLLPRGPFGWPGLESSAGVATPLYAGAVSRRGRSGGRTAASETFWLGSSRPGGASRPGTLVGLGDGPQSIVVVAQAPRPLISSSGTTGSGAFPDAGLGLGDLEDGDGGKVAAPDTPPPAPIPLPGSIVLLAAALAALRLPRR